MPEDIFKGHDCTKEAKVRTRTDKKTGKVTEYFRKLKLEHNRIQATPGTIYVLRLLHVHTLCDDACYTWKIITGAGTLIENTGPEISYRTPEENKECKNNAIIKVYCAGKKLDTAYISINTFPITAMMKKRYTPEACPPRMEEWMYNVHSYTRFETRLGVLPRDPKTEKLYLVDPCKAPLNRKLVLFYYWHDCDGDIIFRCLSGISMGYTTKEQRAKECKALGPRFGQIIDFRTKHLIDEGCCPLELMLPVD